MRKLPQPSFDFSTSKAECLKGVSDIVLHDKYNTQLTPCDDLETDYHQKAEAEELFSLPRVPHREGRDAVVYRTLTKSELMKLYSNYFVPESKDARRLYDQLKVTANGKCPFCGDIGHVRTLDHYLPKANFPVYSVLPGNLVPCCRDCNSEKLNSFSTTKGGQTLHPYFDLDKYFQEKWVCAKVIPSSPPTIEFYPCPPEEWQVHECTRVVAHFEEYGLAERFGTEAGADVPDVIIERKTSLSFMTPDEYSSHLREKSQNLAAPINNWRRVMFDALASDDWFCSHQF